MCSFLSNKIYLQEIGLFFINQDNLFDMIVCFYGGKHKIYILFTSF